MRPSGKMKTKCWFNDPREILHFHIIFNDRNVHEPFASTYLALCIKDEVDNKVTEQKCPKENTRISSSANVVASLPLAKCKNVIGFYEWHTVNVTKGFIL